MFDSHTHVHFAAYRDDWREVIGRALAAGISMVNVGTQRDTSRRAVEIAHLYDRGVYASVGLHPIHTTASYHDAQELGGGEAAHAFTSRGEVFDGAFYLQLARDEKVVAIGECGLD
ncbi:MAG: TatD family hydrolase, partial [Candidatus Colwellbacteria bacterium]|nr:TatD family hydrolase [Candidatus Colwellbacteria bacterium]